MIRIEKRRLKFLLAGRVLAVELPREPVRPYSRSRTYAVALPGKKSATCRVQVLEADGLTLRIRHAPGAEDTPRMLRRGYGYTTDVGSTEDELDAGECLPASVVVAQAEDARRRFEQLRAGEQKRQALRSLERRFRVATRTQDFEALREIGREVDRLDA